MFIDFEIFISRVRFDITLSIDACKNYENEISCSFLFFSYRSAKYLKENAERENVKKVDSPNKRRILKSIKEIEKMMNTQGSGVWANNDVMSLERNLFEITRMLEKGVTK